MSRRRYKTLTHQEYDKKFDRLKAESHILNPQAHPMSETLLRLSDKASLQTLLMELQGDEGRDGEYIAKGMYAKSKLLQASDAIVAVEEDFAALREIKRTTGQRIPDEMPPEMAGKMLKAEAVYDIVQEEIDKITKLLEEFDTAEKHKLDGAVLQHGPIGAGTLKGGVLVEIDGQDVKPDSEDVLRICDERSPYNGMGVVGYREQVVMPWVRERNRQNEEQRKHAEEHGIPISTLAPVRPPLPPRPADVERPESEA